MRLSGSGILASAEPIYMPLKVPSLFLTIPGFWDMSYQVNWWKLMMLPGFQKGDAVTFLPYLNCGKCIACRHGKTNCCASLEVCGVHMDGGMADYYSIPKPCWCIHRDLIYDELAMVEPLSIGAHGIRRANVQPGEFVLVMGAGPIGLAVMEFARIRGAQVIAMDINLQA